jgi:hypothetical protein
MAMNVEQTRTATAYHEAGHAVVGWLLGRKILSIRLYAPGSPTAGMVRLCPRYAGPDWWRFSQDHKMPLGWPETRAAMEIIVLLAGMGAEGVLGCVDADGAIWAFSEDFRRIDELLGEPSTKRFSATMATLHPICRDQLEKHWRRVEALASALLANGRILKDRDVRAILGHRPIKLVRQLVAEISSAKCDLLSPSRNTRN